MCSFALNIEGNSSKFVCWLNKGVQRELGIINTGSLGSTDSPRASVTSPRPASSVFCPPTAAAVSYAAGLDINRDSGYVRETSYKSGTTRPEGSSTSISQPPEVPSVSVAGELIPVPLSTIWPVLHLYKTDEQ